MARQTARVRFTEAGIRSLPLPATGRAIYRDERTPGLGLRVFPTGRRVFFFERKVEGRPERVTLGTWPTLTVEAAQRSAQQLAGQYASGANPAAIRREVRGERTFGEAFELYCKKRLVGRGKSDQAPRYYAGKWLGSWSGRRLSTLTRHDVQDLHERIAEATSGGNANRVLTMVRAVLNFAIRQELLTGDNPATGLDRYRETSRDRFLQPDELPRFFEALKDEPDDSRDFFLLALLTGARRGNLLAMRWEEINFQAATWRMPVTKSGDPHTVPLVGEAIRILEHRHQHRDAKSPWVFPGPGKTGHLQEPKKAWARILARAGIKDLRIHDLRRTLGSWQAATGASLPIIGKTLAHKNVSTTAIYARLNTDPVREAMGKATDAMLEAVVSGRKEQQP